MNYCRIYRRDNKSRFVGEFLCFSLSENFSFLVTGFMHLILQEAFSHQTKALGLMQTSSDLLIFLNQANCVLLFPHTKHTHGGIKKAEFKISH